MKKNNKIFLPVIIILIFTLIYALGFSSNVAYANRDFILRSADYPIDAFNSEIQPFNNLLFYMCIVMFILTIFVYTTESHKRTKLLNSNVITISLLSGTMIIFSLINFLKLPGFISKYSLLLKNHEEEFIRMKRVSSLMPNNNMYYFGLILSAISLIYAIFMIVSLVRRMKRQKEYIAKRNEVLANALWEVKIST